MSASPILVWFRQDLRLDDHPALHVAAASGRPVVPVYVLDDLTPAAWRMGGAARWWLDGSLRALSDSLGCLGSPLVLRRGEAIPTLLSLAQETGATEIVWNRHVEPFWRQAEEALADAAAAHGIIPRGHPPSLLFAAGEVRGQQGAPLRVFTPFWRACRQGPPPSLPLPPPTHLRAPEPAPASDPIDA
jgi:deoxyribodipyrimidine photo-lyase